MYQSNKQSNAKNNKDQLEALPQAGPLRSLRPLSLSMDLPGESLRRGRTGDDITTLCTIDYHYILVIPHNHHPTKLKR